MKGTLGDKQRLLHIIEAITEIEQYTSGQAIDNFLANSMMRFANVFGYLTIISYLVSKPGSSSIENRAFFILFFSGSSVML